MALFNISDEEKKVLEGTEQGRALLKKLQETDSSVEAKLTAAVAKVTEVEARRKELEDKLMDEKYLEALAGARQTTTEPARSQPAEDFDTLSQKDLAAKLIQKFEEKLDAERKSFDKRESELRAAIGAAFTHKELEELEDKHGEKFTTAREKLVELAKQPEFSRLRPKQLWKRYQEQEELRQKREAELLARTEAEKREKAAKQFTERPGDSLPLSTVTSAEPESFSASFDKTWDNLTDEQKKALS